ncbi:MAG: UPF0175 family protein [Bacteroidetes bacterium]|nr:UPF0175 family protein [Bacteroidota bacterium]
MDESQSLRLTIPESVAGAIRLPQDQLSEALLRELAVALYAQNLLSFGKARELADLSKHAFAQCLADHGIARHYGEQDLADDLAYARGE